MSVIPAFMASMLVEKPSKPGFVTEGLIFHLDGSNKGSDPTQWEELVSHEPFKLFNCDVLPNAVNFRGTPSSYAESVNNILQPFHDYGEFQIVFAPYLLSNCVWFSPSQSHGKQFTVGYYNDGVIYSNYTAPVFRTPLSNRQKYTLSVSKNGVVLNTMYSTYTVGNDMWTANNSEKVMIGGRSPWGTPQDMYNGVIYAIRIYNRALSKEEILQNQTYDNEHYFTIQGG